MPSRFKALKPFKVWVGREEMVGPGSFIQFSETLTDGTTRREFGRVMCRVVEFENGTTPKTKHLMVVVPDEMMRFGYHRFIDVKRIVDVCSSKTSDFARWFFGFTDFDPKNFLDLLNYGGVIENYIGKFLGSDGNIDPYWRLTANDMKLGYVVHVVLPTGKLTQGFDQHVALDDQRSVVSWYFVNRVRAIEVYESLRDKGEKAGIEVCRYSEDYPEERRQEAKRWGQYQQ